MNYCCKAIESLVEDKETPFEYDQKFREYSIVDKPEAFRAKSELAIKYQIDYCPRCGTKFPESLRDAWFDIIEREFGISEMPDKKIKLLPKEFLTEGWWKKRGL